MLKNVQSVLFAKIININKSKARTRHSIKKSNAHIMNFQILTVLINMLLIIIQLTIKIQLFSNHNTLQLEIYDLNNFSFLFLKYNLKILNLLIKIEKK